MLLKYLCFFTSQNLKSIHKIESLSFNTKQELRVVHFNVLAPKSISLNLLMHISMLETSESTTQNL